jgi:large repetitive protein
VTATDSDGTPLTGSANFSIVEALSVTNGGSVTAQTAGNAGSITPALTTAGQTGAITYALDATTAALSWVTINTSTGAVAVTSSSVAGTYPVTVTATDSTTAPGSTTAATGTYTFTMHIN